MKTKFRTGNVVRTGYGYLIIICDTKMSINKKHELTSWISFDAENSSGVTRYKTEFIKSDDGETIEIKGMDKAKFVSKSVKDYILEKTLKNFEFSNIY